MGVLFGGLFALYGPTLEFLWLAAFFAALAVVTVTDLKEGVVPYGPLIWSAIVIISLKLVNSRDDFFSDLLVAAILFLVLALPARFNLVGEGDAPVGALIGFSLGPTAAVAALFWAVVLGGAYGVTLLVKDSRNLNKAVPFVPFMTIGCAVAVFLPGTAWFLSYYTVI
jgi:prepilin signal peptidase PulO-like enzyme (type II secretory pathway)